MPKVVCKLDSVVPRAGVRSKHVESNKYLEPKLCEKCEEEGIGISNIVEYVGSDTRNQTKQFGKQERGKGKLVCRELLSSIKTKVFRKAYVSTGAYKSLAHGSCARKSLWVQSSEHGAVQERRYAKTTGQRSRKRTLQSRSPCFWR